MSFIQAKCTNCGATLQVERTADAAVCSYCGSAYIVEKAIEYYNTSNNIYISTVNIVDGNLTNFEIRAGVLVKYIGTSTDVVIPDCVKEIAPFAFSACHNLTSLSIPVNVKITYTSYDEEYNIDEAFSYVGATEQPIYFSRGYRDTAQTSLTPPKPKTAQKRLGSFAEVHSECRNSDSRLAGLRQTSHDSVPAITSFQCSELSLHLVTASDV